MHLWVCEKWDACSVRVCEMLGPTLDMTKPGPGAAAARIVCCTVRCIGPAGMSWQEVVKRRAWEPARGSWPHRREMTRPSRLRAALFTAGIGSGKCHSQPSFPLLSGVCSLQPPRAGQDRHHEVVSSSSALPRLRGERLLCGHRDAWERGGWWHHDSHG